MFLLLLPAIIVRHQLKRESEGGAVFRSRKDTDLAIEEVEDLLCKKQPLREVLPLSQTLNIEQSVLLECAVLVAARLQVRVDDLLVLVRDAEGHVRDLEE